MGPCTALALDNEAYVSMAIHLSMNVLIACRVLPPAYIKPAAFCSVACAQSKGRCYIAFISVNAKILWISNVFESMIFAAVLEKVYHAT